MNFQELLTRLSASCFAADRPDYDWKTLRLFPETGLDLVLIARLAAALILCVIGALVHSTVLRYVLLVLSVLAAGYDYLAAAIACILDRQVFRPAVIVVVCVIGTMAVGQLVDAAVFLLVYRVVSILIAVVVPLFNMLSVVVLEVFRGQKPKPLQKPKKKLMPLQKLLHPKVLNKYFRQHIETEYPSLDTPFLFFFFPKVF